MFLMVLGVVIFQVGAVAVNDMRLLKFYKNLMNLTSAV